MPIDNIDTDMIIPKQYLKTIKRTGLGAGLFAEMRYREDGSEHPDFVLNRPAYRKATIIVGGHNCGWAHRANTRPGPCSTSASAVSSRPTSPTFSITTVSRTAFFQLRFLAKTTRSSWMMLSAARTRR